MILHVLLELEYLEALVALAGGILFHCGSLAAPLWPCSMYIYRQGGISW